MTTLSDHAMASLLKLLHKTCHPTICIFHPHRVTHTSCLCSLMKLQGDGVSSVKHIMIKSANMHGTYTIGHQHQGCALFHRHGSYILKTHCQHNKHTFLPTFSCCSFTFSRSLVIPMFTLNCFS